MDRPATLATQLRLRLSRQPALLLLAPVLGVGLWPYFELLHLWPLTTDSALWVMRGSTENSNWLGWALEKPHFVFYRPVAALSYTLSFWLSGYSGLGYRLLDIALHGGVALLVYALSRELLGDRRGWVSLGAMAFFLLHPVGEEVIPFLARRGYLLMTLFGAGSVLAFARSCRNRRVFTPATAVSSLLLMASLLATEINFALVPLYPILAAHLCWERERRTLRPLLRSTPLFVSAAAVYLLRNAILGNVGGYENVQRSAARFGSLFIQALEYPLFPSSPVGEPAWMPLGGVAAAAISAYYLWRVGVAPLRSLDVSAERIHWVLAAWVLGTIALPAVFGVWFYRHSYPLLVPLSIGFAHVAARTFQRHRTQRLRLLLHLAPQLALLASVSHFSPVVRGLDPSFMASRTLKQARMQELAGDLEQIEGPAVVYLVLPFETPDRIDPGWHDPGLYGMRRMGFWAQALTRGREIEFRDLLYLGPAPDGQRIDTTRYELRGGRPVLVLPSAIPLRFTRFYVKRQTELPLLRLDELPVRAGRNGYVYYLNDIDGHLVSLGHFRPPP